MDTANLSNKQVPKHGKSPTFNPFPGLRPFTTEESHLFFGREGQSRHVLNYLAKNRFVGLLGTSGSGKSSLMYCGVIPVLQGGFIADAGSGWKIINCRPGQNPLANLVNALVQSYPEELNATLTKEYVHSVVSSSSLGLINSLKQLHGNRKENILLLIDQFEELFRFKRIKNSSVANDEAAAYIKMIMEAVDQSEIPVYTVMTMRSDFIGDCAHYQDLTKKVNDSHYLIPQMTREDFREAILGPVAVGGGEISQNLVQQLLNDIGDNPDQLPILQHALMRTWESWVASGRTHEPIGIKDYENIGKFDKALSEHANEAYNELLSQEKNICETIFKTITEKGGDNRGVRRPSSIQEIADIAQVGPEKVIQVVEHFRAKGRSFITPPPHVDLNAESVIDISHESLMRIWRKLIMWVGEEYEAVQMYKRLAHSAEKFQLGETNLWRPPDLQLALNWKEKQKPTLTWAVRHHKAFERTMVFLETSQKEHELEEANKIRMQKKALRRSRLFAIVLGSASIISLFFMINSFVATRNAEEQAVIAKQQEENAKQSAAEAQKQQSLAEEQRSIALDREQEANQQRELADAERLKAQLSAEEAKRQEGIAISKSKEASQQREIAEQKADEARAQQQLAEQANIETQKLRMQSISKSMAVKSVQIDVDTALQALVAYQAYVFNTDFGGDTFDDDVYNALYFAQKMLYGKQETDYLGHKSWVRDLEFNAQMSTSFYSVGSDGNLFYWKDKSNFPQLIYQDPGMLRTLAVSDDGKNLVAGDNSGRVKLIIESDTATYAKILYQHEKAINDILFISDHEIICASSNQVSKINVITGQVNNLYSLFGAHSLHKYADGFFALDANGRVYQISTNQSDTIYNYSLIRDAEGLPLRLSRNLAKSDASQEDLSIKSMDYSKNGKWLALGDINGVVMLFDTENHELIQRLSGHRARVNKLNFSSDNSLLIAASNDGSLLVWNMENLNLSPIKLRDNGAWVIGAKFNDDNSAVYAYYADGKIRKWPVNTSEMADKVRSKITRNFTQEEWNSFVASDINYEKTIKTLP